MKLEINEKKGITKIFVERMKVKRTKRKNQEIKRKKKLRKI